MAWNDTRTEYPSDKSSTSCSRSRSARTPEAVAVVFEEEELTYDQLNTRPIAWRTTCADSVSVAMSRSASIWSDRLI